MKNILHGKITLNNSVYRQLSRHKKILRYITNKFNINYILKNYNAFSEIMKIMLKQNNESHQESSSHSLQRVESKQKTHGRGKCYYLTNKKTSDNQKNRTKCSSEEDKPEKEEEGKKETERYENENESSPECKKKQKVKVKKVKPIVPLLMKNNEEKELQGQGKANDDVNIVNIGKEKDEEDEQF